MVNLLMTFTVGVSKISILKLLLAIAHFKIRYDFYL